MSNDAKYNSRIQGSSEEILINVLQAQVLRKTNLYVSFDMCEALQFKVTCLLEITLESYCHCFLLLLRCDSREFLKEVTTKFIIGYEV